MTSRRQRKVAELLHKEISELIQYQSRDPRFGFVTVTDVEVTADLRTAWVYITALSDKNDSQETLDGLNGASGYFRHRLGQALSLRYIPQINFKLDSSLKHSLKIETILDTLKEEEQRKSD